MDFQLTSLSDNLPDRSAAVIAGLLALNDKTAEFGIILNKNDAKLIAEADRAALAEQERVEFGESAACLITEKFASSPYISQRGCGEAFAELVGIFYEAKEECLDLLSDEEVVDAMRYFFDNVSQGSTELLASRDMDALCRSLRGELGWK